jgi:uncharacterized protein (DUF849 family)
VIGAVGTAWETGLVLQACVNGARSRDEHPALPVTSVELARDVAAVAAVGVDAVHLHVKDDQGADILEAHALAATLAAVRQAAPGLPVGVTTGAWALSDSAARVTAVRSWSDLRMLPDFASVNWHEYGADDVAAALLEVGVAWRPGCGTSTRLSRGLPPLIATGAYGCCWSCRTGLAQLRSTPTTFCSWFDRPRP